MSRPKRVYLQRAHLFLLGWGEWMDMHIDSSAIGHRKQTAEASAGEGRGDGKPSSICPEVMMPEWVSIVDHALNVMPPDLYVVIVKKYRYPVEEIPRKKLDEVLLWVAGRIGC